jgi:hypothetical protein
LAYAELAKATPFDESSRLNAAPSSAFPANLSSPLGRDQHQQVLLLMGNSGSRGALGLSLQLGV